LLAGLIATLNFECEFQIKIDAIKVVRRKFLVQEQMSYRRGDIVAMSTYDGATTALSRIRRPDLLIMCALSRKTGYETSNISAAMRLNQSTKSRVSENLR
jgi:hypothetical protein